MRTFPVSQSIDQFKTDQPRDQLARNVAYRLKNWIPQNGASPRKRGGWEHGSADLNALSATTYVSGVAWAPYQSDPHLISVGNAGKVYQIKTFDNTGGSYLGTTSFSPLTWPPFWWYDRMIICQARGQTAIAPQKITKSGATYTLAVVGGTPPEASCGMAWGDYVVLANGEIGATAYPQRVWWSASADSETWSTGTSFWDMPGEVVGCAVLRNVQVFFGYDATWMLIGDTPPPGGNLSLRTLFANTGCMDGRTIKQYRDYVIWANNSGVWKSDGATLTDLTARGGISSYWIDTVGDFNFSEGHIASAGILYGHYIISVLDQNRAELVTLACDIESEAWFELTNFKAAMYAERPSGPGTATADGNEELFFANAGSVYAEKVSPCWTPVAGNSADDDGASILPQLETAFYRLDSTGMKRIRRAFITYDIRDPAATAPYLTVGFVTSPENTSYTTASETLAAVTAEARRPASIRRKALGVALKLTQVGESSDTRLAGIEIEGHPMEQARR